VRVVVFFENEYVADSAADCLLTPMTASRTITDRRVRSTIEFATT